MAWVLKDSLERAASTDRDKVRDAVAKTNLTDHILTQDAIRFDDTGEGIAATPALLQVQNGKPMVVGPARFAETKPIFPVPRWKGRPADAGVEPGLSPAVVSGPCSAACTGCSSGLTRLRVLASSTCHGAVMCWDVRHYWSELWGGSVSFRA